uniref:Uncharacterized protein n=1 Tax=Vespula pensylvanica TaxID=30213 RepID=A0A834NWQ7_VESPE|nr:hypothetical protein H0235_010250 [Vespula pensylvanica]
MMLVMAAIGISNENHVHGIEVAMKNGERRRRRRNEPMSSSSSSSSFAVYVVHARVFGSDEAKRSKLSVVIVRAIRKSSYFTYDRHEEGR